MEGLIFVFVYKIFRILDIGRYTKITYWRILRDGRLLLLRRKQIVNKKKHTKKNTKTKWKMLWWEEGR